MWRNDLTIKNKAIGELTTGALFFGMRPCEYLKTVGERRTKLLRIKNFRFFIQKQEIDKVKNTVDIFKATTISVNFESQKNDEKDDLITMHANNKELCPVKTWATIINRILSYPGTSIHSPINTILVGKQMSLIRDKEVIKHIRATVSTIGKNILGFDPKEVGIHSIRSSFAMFLYIRGVRTDRIMLQGRWKSDAFLIYLRKQVAEFSKGLSEMMIHMDNEYFNIPSTANTTNSFTTVNNTHDPRVRNPFSFASSLNNNGPGSQRAQTMRPNFHLWS